MGLRWELCVGDNDYFGFDVLTKFWGFGRKGFPKQIRLEKGFICSISEYFCLMSCTCTFTNNKQNRKDNLKVSELHLMVFFSVFKCNRLDCQHESFSFFFSLKNIITMKIMLPNKPNKLYHKISFIHLWRDRRDWCVFSSSLCQLLIFCSFLREYILLDVFLSWGVLA